MTYRVIVTSVADAIRAFAGIDVILRIASGSESTQDEYYLTPYSLNKQNGETFMVFSGHICKSHFTTVLGKLKCTFHSWLFHSGMKPGFLKKSRFQFGVDDLYHTVLLTVAKEFGQEVPEDWREQCNRLVAEMSENVKNKLCSEDCGFVANGKVSMGRWVQWVNE